MVEQIKPSRLKPKLTRIEEVKARTPKELLADYGGEVMALVQKGEPQKLAALTDKAYEELCQLFPQPLDDKEWREKARLTDEERKPICDGCQFSRDWANTVCYECQEHLRRVAKLQQDKDFPLLQPKIEEAVRQEKIRSLRERNEESGLPFILALEGRK